MWKSFYDFVRKASRMYGLPFNIARQYILQQLNLKKLTPKDIVCYINWADGDCLTQFEIGKHLKITQQSVLSRLQKIQRVWPHLFQFGPSSTHNFSSHKCGREYRISTNNIDENEIVHKF